MLWTLPTNMGRRKIFHWTLFMTIAVLSLHCSYAVYCPTNCKCSWVLDSLDVNCANRGLIDYPDLQNIPVQHLDLSGNYFIEFPQHLADYESLIYLDLSNNQIEYLSAEALVGFHSLRTLILANNSIHQWADINPSIAFVNALNLQRLVLSGNQLNVFNADDHRQVIVSESLTHLELENCGIAKAGGDLLIQNMPNLQRLKLNNNPLSGLAALPSKTLRVLEMKNCNLQRIPGSLLQGLPVLDSLILSWNTALQVDTMNRLESSTLSELDLSYCSLDDIDLSLLPRLTHLQLTGNMIRSLTSHTFENNTQLEVISLSRNSLRVLETETFQNLKRLSALDLSYNEIARLDRNLFRANDNLLSLNLNHNYIEKLTKLVSNSLRDINLSWCEIILIDGTAFLGFSSLQKLDLSNNLISDFPSGMGSNTLQKLDLSYCRLSTLRNTTFQHFPELAQLKLNGNRFTNPFPRQFFQSNKYLDEIYAGDNTWICHCEDPTFVDFHDYLTAPPTRIKDRNSLRCASPTINYGKTWEAACEKDWIPNQRSTSAEKVWSTIVLSILAIAGLICMFTCFQKYMAWRRKQMDQEEYQRNQDEMRAIRDLNRRILDEDARPNAPNNLENNLLPSYEDALRMPKPVRPVKSMLDLTTDTSRRRSRLKKSRTNPEDDISQEEEPELDYRTRFRSEEMLSNRDKERVQQMGPTRRTGHITYNPSGSRLFAIEDSRFPPAHLKSQNLQSAEKIGNFQSYENSPYTKRRPKIAEIPPFKRASLRADSVEFLTDPEFDTISKPNSPFAQRKPKKAMAPGPPLTPAVEDYFGDAPMSHKEESPEGSDFHVIIEPEIQSLRGVISSSDSNAEIDLIKGKRKKLRNSSSRRASGNFTAAAAAAADGDSSEEEPVIVVHRPMRETLF
ncbi:leucine-rich repeat-containing G-protein coupled receptor 5 [Stomoxys calcitrans]|uniref:leucine-rich repeat-containing G-protein coupled receptor 5 n=1 Tax=Stomoxys calcitrans TaxID=35570 RepID=UPI0027E307B0|nr:leucine-rich repeat-containing G-protein coupled receptor 5 [Stomoxys calcitrans]